MSDQDLINFEGEEHGHVNGDAPPGIEVTPPEEEKLPTEVPEVVQKEQVEVAATETSVISTASIDLNVAETPVAEETAEVSVEFEQLELTDKPVSKAPIANDVRHEMELKIIKTAKRPNSNQAAESKIAMEIREMREREEELRKMRERVALKPDTAQPQNEVVINERIPSDGSTKSEDFLEDGRDSPSADFQNKKVERAVSLDSLHGGQTYNVGYAFGHRRKDQIKVKPLDDGETNNDNESKQQRYRALKESPIEREIRLTREREDALRKEKGLVENREDRRQLQKSIRNAKTPEPPVMHADTQRLLATNRIQQEIQEQTKREMALRESGHIQTISQERTDSKVTKIRESVNSPSETNGGGDKKQCTLPVVDIYEKTNGHSVNGNDKSPSPPASSSSSTNAVPPGRRLSNPQAPGRGISMQRFIKSKGKDIGFAAFPGSYKENIVTDYYEIRPPQMRRVNGHSGPVAPRRSLTAESKIQEELKEMKAREEELRKQRARLLGLSQPNLSLLVNDDDLVTNGEEESNLDRSNSNPNLLDDHSIDTIEGTDEQDFGFGSIKRRSNLIAQWEQRIQKAEAKS